MNLVIRCNLCDRKNGEMEHNLCARNNGEMEHKHNEEMMKHSFKEDRAQVCPRHLQPPHLP